MGHIKDALIRRSLHPEGDPEEKKRDLIGISLYGERWPEKRNEVPGLSSPGEDVKTNPWNPVETMPERLYNKYRRD